MEDKAISDIVDLLLPENEPPLVRAPEAQREILEAKRDRLRWALKELVNAAAAKGRGQIQ